MKITHFWRGNGTFLSLVWVNWKQSACSITPLYSDTFTACFYHFLLWRYLNFSITRFASEILLLFPNLNDLKSRESLQHLQLKPWPAFYNIQKLNLCSKMDIRVSHFQDYAVKRNDNDSQKRYELKWIWSICYGPPVTNW